MKATELRQLIDGLFQIKFSFRILLYLLQTSNKIK